MPHREIAQLQAVHRFLNLDLNKDSGLQEIVELAAELCHTTVALITLIGEDIQYFKSLLDPDIDKNGVRETFCQYVIDNEHMLVIPDATQDARFLDNSCVVNDHLRFYAGVPLITHDGLNLGVMCVLDIQPKTISSKQEHLLMVLAKRVIELLEFEFSINLLKTQFLNAKDAEIKLHSFFESSLACHLLIGRKNEILAYNKNMLELMQRLYNVTICAGMNVSELLKKEALSTFMFDYQNALTGKTRRFEREVKYPSGEMIWWEITYQPAYNEIGEIIGVSYNANDITERKSHERHISTQNESLRQIAHIQSHEVRKPLATILGLVELFQSENYSVTKEEILMLKSTAIELDNKIREIIHFADRG